MASSLRAAPWSSQTSIAAMGRWPTSNEERKIARDRCLPIAASDQLISRGLKWTEQPRLAAMSHVVCSNQTAHIRSRSRILLAVVTFVLSS